MTDQDDGKHLEGPREVPGVQNGRLPGNDENLNNCEYFRNFMNVIKYK